MISSTIILPPYLSCQVVAANPAQASNACWTIILALVTIVDKSSSTWTRLLSGGRETAENVPLQSRLELWCSNQFFQSPGLHRRPDCEICQFLASCLQHSQGCIDPPKMTLVAGDRAEDGSYRAAGAVDHQMNGRPAADEQSRKGRSSATSKTKSNMEALRARSSQRATKTSDLPRLPDLPVVPDAPLPKSREGMGRQFTVGTVGAKGMIFLKWVQCRSDVTCRLD